MASRPHPPAPSPARRRGARGTAGFSQMWVGGGNAGRAASTSWAEESSQHAGNSFRGRIGCGMDASPLTPVSVVRASLSGRGPKCLLLASALARIACFFGQSATRRRPVFLNSRRDVMCCLTVRVSGAGNVGLRGRGAHDSPSCCSSPRAHRPPVEHSGPASAATSCDSARVRRGMRVAG